MSCRRSAGGVLVLFGAAVVLMPGCLVYEVASVPVKVATKTVEVAGRTTVAVVETTGKVAVSTVRAAGSVTSGGIDASAKLARVGMVTFTDAASGAVTRVPWSRGLTLYNASAAARVNMARAGIKILRNGKVVYSATPRAKNDVTLQSGDVVRLDS